MTNETLNLDFHGRLTWHGSERITSRKAGGFNEIPTVAWKIRIFDDILLPLSNAVYNQNTIEIWTKDCILPFSKKGNLGISKNYSSIIITDKGVEIYAALLLNHIWPEVEKVHKNQYTLSRNQSTTSDSDYLSNHWKNTCKKKKKKKKSQGKTLVCRVLQSI